VADSTAPTRRSTTSAAARARATGYLSLRLVASARHTTLNLGGLKTKKLPDNTKALLLGLKITDLVSTEVLLAAKPSLGSSILIEDPELYGQEAHDDSEGVPSEPNGHPARGDPADSLVDTVPIESTSSASPDLPQTPQTPDPA
jgi:hypothetical protein